jgi:hypothetical protein
MASPEILPALLESFWQAASCAIARAPRLDKDDFERAVVGIAPGDSDARAAAIAYQHWLRAIPIAEVIELVGCPEAESCLRLLLECVRPVRGIETPSTPLALRLPLGRLGGAAVCFWIDLVRRAAGWRATIPSFFWAHDGSQGTMLLCLGAPSRATLGALWAPRPDVDEICDVTVPVGALASLPDLAVGVRSALQGPDRRALDLLDAVSAGST